MKRLMIVLLALGFVVPVLAREARAGDDVVTLKKRFKDRYPTLERLKDEGKLGETSKGFADAVDRAYLDDKVDASDKNSETVAAFLGAENADRKQLYALIAKKSGATVEKVAERNARRVFERAKPDHYLKMPSGKWVQKKNLKKKQKKRTASTQNR